MAKGCNIFAMTYNFKSVLKTNLIPKFKGKFVKCFSASHTSFMPKNCTQSAAYTTFLQNHLLGPLPCFFNQTRQFSNLLEDDDNDRALKELDITLLKPHPEWRNVAAGPVWGKGDQFHQLLWKKWLKMPNIQKQKFKQENAWDKYSRQHGHTPVDYMKSEEFIDQYQGKLTWQEYFRNKKGFIQRQKTRRNCKTKGVITTGSPCPLCRDEMLLTTYKNIPLLIEYIDQQTGKLHNSLRTGVCQAKQRDLVWSFELAQHLGYLPRIVPFVRYDFKEFRLNHHVL